MMAMFLLMLAGSAAAQEEKEMTKILEADEINEYCELYINGQYALAIYHSIISS